MKFKKCGSIACILQKNRKKLRRFKAEKNYDQPTQVQAVVVVFGVAGLRRVDDDQDGSPEMSSMACSSEIKEDGLRFVLRVSEELYLNIYWILNIIWIYNIYIF